MRTPLRWVTSGGDQENRTFLSLTTILIFIGGPDGAVEKSENTVNLTVTATLGTRKRVCGLISGKPHSIVIIL